MNNDNQTSRTSVWSHPAFAEFVLIVTGLFALTVFSAFSSPFFMHIAILTAFAIVLGLSCRLMFIAGESSFCHGTFYGLGAYTVAILTIKAGLPFWAIFALSALVAALFAVVIGYVSLRTRGPYFFLMTFGFLIVINAVFSNARSLTGGHAGLVGVPSPYGINDQSGFYWFAAVFCLAAILVFWRLERSPWGLQLRALGSSVDLSQSIGIGRLGNLLAAFIFGAAVAGLTGGIYASYITYVGPSSFSYWVSIYILTYIIIGGARYFPGVIAGAVLLTVLPVAFSWSQNLVSLYFAAGIVLTMMLLPKGIVTTLVDNVSVKSNPKHQNNKGTGQVPSGLDSVARSPDGDAGESLLEVKELDHWFGGLHVTKKIDFTVGKGEVTGIVGPNGAGKTTLLNLVCGQLKPDYGDVYFLGDKITGRNANEISRMGLVRTFQHSAVFESLSVFENILVSILTAQKTGLVQKTWRGWSGDINANREAEEILQLVGLYGHKDKIAENLPYGTKKILGLAIALAARPTLLCLDEPTTGLVREELEGLLDVLRELHTRLGFGLIIVEHRLEVIAELCASVVVLDQGSMVANGLPKEVFASDIVQEIYFGRERQ